MKKITIVSSLLLILLSSAIHADIAFFSDNFNRADSNTIGNNWIEAEDSSTDIQLKNNEAWIRSNDGYYLKHESQFLPTQVYFNIKSEFGGDNNIYIGTSYQNIYLRVFDEVIVFMDKNDDYYEIPITVAYHTISLRNINFSSETYDVFINDEETYVNITMSNDYHTGLGTTPYFVVHTRYADLYLDDVYFFNHPEGIPIIFNINCSSSGDNTSPYSTEDTTPTFRFETTVDSNCRIGSSNQSYNTMGSLRDCSTTGLNEHICTSSDAIYDSNAVIYISCQNIVDNNESTTALQMNISGLEELDSSDAIQFGIEASTVYPDMTVYDNQQVYLRDASDNQLLTTVDKVVVYGNQRWLLNYALANESTLGLFNITPVIYVLDMQNRSYTDIKNTVRDFIDNTKN